MYKFIFLLLLFFINSNSLFAKTSITVSYPIVKYFIEKIANDNFYVKVVFDKSRQHSLENKETLEYLADNDYYFKIDLEQEEPVIRKLTAINKNLKVVDISKNIKKLKINDNKENPYIWLDPILVREIAKNIYEQLVRDRYYEKDELEQNYTSFLKEIDDIYLHLKKRLDNSEVYGFFAFHHDLDYFAKRFRLNTLYQEYRYLKISEVPDIVKLSQKEHIKHVVIPKGSSYEIGQSISGHINGKIVEIDVFSENWKSNLYVITRKIAHF